MLSPVAGQPLVTVSRRARCDGRSNAEIGERLFISRHTVAYHLRGVFAKLDITANEVLADGAGAGQVV